ncbi:chalcone isomerase family protein [uncultured Desulfosarcina sp.]|uniref:chalcone isomerase family protein n=1 Tax=uncultured Desulfosarcina sp. TaxID=218289 RepID=UPI0029C8F18D|nr:chalcone isomerase family protein [uncultured Desulfosarcina sp.]
MSRRVVACAVALFFVFVMAGAGFAGEVEILGVKFPTEKTIEGKTLKLNGVSYLKKLGFVKVYAVGLYLENPSKDPKEVIESEQVKYMLTHYLTSKATAKKISEGFIELMEAGNPKDLVDANRADIEKYASWLDKDMKPGLTSESLYVPGKGITLTYQGQVKGTIPGNTFAQMYYRYNVGEKADKKIREGLLGL